MWDRPPWDQNDRLATILIAIGGSGTVSNVDDLLQRQPEGQLSCRAFKNSANDIFEFYTSQGFSKVRLTAREDCEAVTDPVCLLNLYKAEVEECGLSYSST